MIQERFLPEIYKKYVVWSFMTGGLVDRECLGWMGSCWPTGDCSGGSHPGVGANCPLSCCRSFFSTLSTRFTHMSGNSIVQLWKLLTEVEEVYSSSAFLG